MYTTTHYLCTPRHLKRVHQNTLKRYTGAPLKPRPILTLRRCAIPSMDYTIVFNDRMEWKKGKKDHRQRGSCGYGRFTRGGESMNSTVNAQNPYQTAFRSQKMINPVHTCEKQAPDRCTFLMCSRAESLPACGKPLF
jgi:hypothetical protein